MLPIWSFDGLYFNPRSPYGERLGSFRGRTRILLFQSTLPLRGATFQPASTGIPHAISIHAPLTGSDPRFNRFSSFRLYFNPRSPYGERPPFNVTLPGKDDFNPRSPYGERPYHLDPILRQHIFQSTLPLRGATIMRRTPKVTVKISIHAPLTGSDCKTAQNFT